MWGWRCVRLGFPVAVLCVGALGLSGCGDSVAPPTTATGVTAAPVEPESPSPATDADTSETAAPPVKEHEGRRLATTLFQFNSLKYLVEESVQSRLELTSEQVTRLAPYCDEAESRADALRKVSQEDLSQKLTDVYIPVARTYQKVLQETLSQRQQDDLWKLVVRRQRGAVALLLPRVPEHLEMTDEQIDGVAAILFRNMKLMDPSKISPFAMPGLLQRAIISRGEAERLLTEDQRTRWRKLLEE